MASRKKKTGRSRQKRSGGKKRQASKGVLSRLVHYSAEASVFIFTGVIFLGLGLAWFAKDLPRTDNLWRTDREARLTFLSAEGAPLPLHGVSAGAPVRLADLPAHVPGAILAVEDRNFYHHVGVNPISVVRAFIVNASEGEVRQGGSTITQQLAKNLFLSSEKTLKRKIQELMLALWLEHRFSKDEILTLYLNRVYFGAGAYGVDAASHRYFGKPAKNLSVNEAAVLAGLLKAPSRYSPTQNPKDAGVRARLAIEAMVTANMLTPDEADNALAAPVFLASNRRTKAPYFLDYAYGQAYKLAARHDADLVIQTTLNSAIQSALEAGVNAGLEKAALADDIEVAAVILDTEGAVLAMAGGRDYGVSQFNRAVQARRQPGSAFKPFVFLTALEQGMRPDTMVLDAPVSIGDWSPDNYNSQFFGEVTLTQAMAQSLNSVAIRLQEQTSRNAVRLTSRRMGLDASLSSGPALALGVDAVSPMMLAAAYTPFANGGYRVRPHAIAHIATTDQQNVYRHEDHFDGIAASAYPIAAVNEMLAAVTTWGTGRAAAIEGVDVFGKTGTTQNNRDAWFAGHAGGLVCVVWLGRDDNSSMGDITGGQAPAMIWREIVTRALAHRRGEQTAPKFERQTAVTLSNDPVAEILSKQN